MAKTKKTTSAKTKKPKETAESKVNVSELEKAIESVDTEIKDDTIKIEEPDTSLLEHIVEKITEVEQAQNELNDKLEKNPEKAEEIITEELKKAEQLKEEVKKIMKSVNPTTFTWNGMVSDF